MVAELFVTGDREFQTAGAVILNALDWKLILVAGRRNGGTTFLHALLILFSPSPSLPYSLSSFSFATAFPSSPSLFPYLFHLLIPFPGHIPLVQLFFLFPTFSYSFLFVIWE